MIKNEKGITLVILILTIVIMLILSASVVKYTKISSSTQNYNKMMSDIEILEDKILIYYNKYAELPTIGEQVGLSNLPTGGIYKKIDLTKLNNISLNYGGEDGSEDYYVIDMLSHNVYYVEGIVLNNITYYSN